MWRASIARCICRAKRSRRGLTPGSDYPVFRTDFGTVGLMICYDVFFADPARALALKGAEMILMPIWGGDETLAKARAIENKVFLVASGYDYPTYVMDPDGERLHAPRRGGRDRHHRSEPPLPRPAPRRHARQTDEGAPAGRKTCATWVRQLTLNR